MKKLPILLILSFLFFAPVVSAQELFNSNRGTFRAEVVRAGEVVQEDIVATGVTAEVQEITVRLLEGPQENTEVELINDFGVELTPGDRVFINHWVDINETSEYALNEIERSSGVFILFGAFALLLIAFGGRQGFRALIALVGSILAIFYILIPALIAGFNPVLVSTGVAAIVLFLALFFTHGFNKTALTAFLGTVIAVVFTGLIAWFSTDALNLTGIVSEDEVYLNFNTGGTLDFAGLLLGAIIIGVLGALDDIAITQAATVREFYSANKEISHREVFTRAMRVGREHVSALVNTLVLAYTGAALPLLLLFLHQTGNPTHLFNMEVFVTEIVRMIVGSMGLILTVPITTLLAVWLLEKYRGKELGQHEHVHAHVHH